jgi:zinc/manganese transport system ATP-binding protein
VALDGINGQFLRGSLTGVVGENGAGKSSLLAAIAGTARLASGVVDFAVPGRLAYLPQTAAIDTSYPLTVAELIMLGGWREFGAFRAPGTSLRLHAASAAATVGLTALMKRRISELSVGLLQRALFARLILQDADVILLDEPFAAVDEQSASVLLEQIRRWHRERRTVIAVLHDLDMVRRHFPSTVVLAQRCIAWGPTDIVLPALAA